jgi:DNA-binding PadR family transcriptional regulator
MNAPLKLSHTSGLILHTISRGYRYGFDIMDVTGLPSGTVYPALRRLERQAWVQSSWEDEQSAPQRPARKYYRLTRLGKSALEEALRRYPLLSQIAPRDKAQPHARSQV